jgi:nicotinamide riboside kinase
VQAEREDDAAAKANGLLFCDTDLFTTARFHEAYTGTAAAALEELALTRRYDLYLLCALDVPFVQDGWRDDGPHRPALDAALRRYLRATDARWVELSGPYDARLLGAVAAVDELLADADVHGFADSARRASSSILPCAASSCRRTACRAPRRAPRA